MVRFLGARASAPLGKPLRKQIFSPDADEIQKRIDDEEWFLWTDVLYDSFGNAGFEAKYLQVIGKVFWRCLKSELTI
jgi:hypothetical protein